MGGNKVIVAALGSGDRRKTRARREALDSLDVGLSLVRLESAPGSDVVSSGRSRAVPGTGWLTILSGRRACSHLDHPDLVAEGVCRWRRQRREGPPRDPRLGGRASCLFFSGFRTARKNTTWET